MCEPGGDDFSPLVVESCGRRCPATHMLLNLFGPLAAHTGRVCKRTLVEGALWRLSTALCIPCARPLVNIPAGALRCLRLYSLFWSDRA